MGLETGALVLASVAAGATVAKVGVEVAAQKETDKALDLQAKQATIQFQQKNLSNLETMQKVLDEQAVALTTRGVAFSSPSFNAIQRATYNIGAKKSQNLKTEENIVDENVRIEKENSKNALYATIFGDVASTAEAGINIMAKTPRKLPQMEA